MFVATCPLTDHADADSGMSVRQTCAATGSNAVARTAAARAAARRIDFITDYCDETSVYWPMVLFVRPSTLPSTATE